jgi:hypothetical protein
MRQGFVAVRADGFEKAVDYEIIFERDAYLVGDHAFEVYQH